MKTPKTFRIEQYTLNRLNWMAEQLKTTETAIVERAINELYMREYHDMASPTSTQSGPMCCRPICEQCPLESIIAAGLDICADDCAAANCPHYHP